MGADLGKTLGELLVQQVFEPVDHFSAQLFKLCGIDTSGEGSDRDEARDACRTLRSTGVIGNVSDAVKTMRNLRHGWTSAADVASRHPAQACQEIAPQATQRSKAAGGRGRMEMPSLLQTGASGKSMFHHHNLEHVFVSMLLSSSRPQTAAPRHDPWWTGRVEDVQVAKDILGHLWDPKHPAGSDHRARDKSKTLAVVPHQTAAPAKPWGVSQKAPADAGKHVVENDSEKLEEKLLKAEDIIDTTLSTIHLAEVTKTAAFAGEAMNKIGLPYDLKNLVKGLGTIASNKFAAFDLIGGVRSIGHQLMNVGLGLEVLTVVEDILALAVWSDVLIKSSQAVQHYAVGKVGADDLVIFQAVASMPWAPSSAPASGRRAPSVASTGAGGDAALDMGEAELAAELVKGSDAVVRLIHLLQKLPVDLCFAFGALSALAEDTSAIDSAATLMGT